MFLWIDPPGAEPGWIHEITGTEADDAAAVIGQYPIPDDNAARQQAYDDTSSGEHTVTVDQYQAGRDFWGITAMTSLPDDLPSGIIMVTNKKREKS